MLPKNTTKLLILTAILLVSVTAHKTEQSYCNSKPLCGECIRTKGCMWCYAPNINGYRCNSPEESSIECGEEHLIDPDNTQYVMRSQPLTGAKSDSGSPIETVFDPSVEEEFVIVKPQEIHLHSNVDETQTIRMEYVFAEKYPVDVYFLVASTNFTKNAMENFGDIATALRNTSSNFRIGLGTFAPSEENTPSSHHSCKSTEFVNVMPLSPNTEYITDEIRNLNVSHDLNALESSLGLIPQAVFKPEEIGWRQTARRFLVVVTNTGICTENTEQIKENDVNLIFAAPSTSEAVYKELVKQIDGATYVKLNEKSLENVEVLKEEYIKILSRVELRDNSTNIIEVMYKSSCLDKDDSVTKNQCENLKAGDVVSFSVEITLKECPKDESLRRQVFEISPKGISESLVVYLYMICDCQCETIGFGNPIHNEELCFGHGTYSCGLCHCEHGYFGRNCECQGPYSTQEEASKQCKENEATNVECSGRGDCICGQCSCHLLDDVNKTVSGRYCECDNFSCAKNNGELCSGADRGVCECGQCKCRSGYKGDGCQCHENDTKCTMSLT